MLDLFAAAPPNVRRARLEEYHRYLVERDGEMNLEERTLSRREASMKKYETPPKALRDMDADEFSKKPPRLKPGRTVVIASNYDRRNICLANALEEPSNSALCFWRR